MQNKCEKKLCGHLIVSVVAISIFFANISHSGVWFADMSSHALNGVFYKDMIEEGGFFDPVRYAERYYVQYPSLTIGMYPPVFYTFEALLFKLFGVSPKVAKLAVCLFTLLGVNVFFLLCRLWFPIWLSAVGSVLYLMQPSALFAQKNVMLEMPFLTMSIIAVYCLYIGTERDRLSALFFAPLFTATAFLTRQSAIFLVPIWSSWIILRKKWWLMTSGRFILGVLAGATIVVPWGIVNLTVGKGHLAHLNFGVSHIWPNCLFYLRHLSEVASFPVIVLSVLSVILFHKLRYKDGYQLSLLWVCSVIVFLLPMKLSEPRYAIGLLPPLIVLSMHAIRFLKEKFTYIFQRSSICFVVILVLICFHIDPRKVWDSPDIQGFDQVADFVASDLDCVSVLYDGLYNGNFIFHMRMRDKDRRVFVFRASKVVFSTAFHLELGYNQLVKEAPEFYDVLERYAIKYVVQEERDSLKTPANKSLRQWMQGPEFKLVRECRIRCRGLDGFGNLLVYEYLDYEAKPLRQIDLDMPVMERKISVKLE